MVQLDIFSLEEKLDIEDQKVVLLVEDQKVKVLPPDICNHNCEDYYYLKDFENEKGFIIRAHQSKKVSYSVDFGDKQGVFYQEELQAI
ncbi:hypothetical protein [Metabacillus fastidiosus]|uniref:hypothetical protein n=1 Tax=Metabacillus fastidiosus TaxID=1458 RepID=UPI002E20A162|nr:hypothetical protein [Metabacillus fastidiosus]